jgi:magnesium transporter
VIAFAPELPLVVSARWNRSRYFGAEAGLSFADHFAMADRTRTVLDDIALRHASRSFAELRPEQTVDQALGAVRSQPLDSAVVYFYVIDENRRLQGVVSTRRLLTSAPDIPISRLMTGDPVSLTSTATLQEAAAVLVRHRLLAVPIVDSAGRMFGVVDAAALGVDVETELSGQRVNELFQLIGVRLVGPASFVSRFPSLLWNVTGGLIAALIAGAHERLLGAFTSLALFMPVTLALSESVGIQSVVLAIERREQPGSGSSWRSVARRAGREAGIALLLGLVCAVLVGAVAAVWQRDARLTAVIALAIPFAMLTSASVGQVLPRALYAMRRNPHLAAGPMVLAIADFVSLMVYFRVALFLMR